MQAKITELMTKHDVPYPRETVLVWNDSFDWHVPRSIVDSIHVEGCRILYYFSAYHLWITRNSQSYPDKGLCWGVKIAECPPILDLPVERHTLNSGETCVLNTTVVEDLKALHGISRRRSINMLEEANA